ncbi:hypothetical protein TNCV_3954641 [Trichonephila clavipes]|nr:hypothetical protein TNCV_3954641 [Trichonephila clavipes]
MWTVYTSGVKSSPKEKRVQQRRRSASSDKRRKDAASPFVREDVARELGVEVNSDLRKVETKDRILQNENNDIETIKLVMEGVLEENERDENKEREEKERERLIRDQ